MSTFVQKADIVLSMNGKQAKQVIKSLEQEAIKLGRQIENAAKAGDKVKMQRLQRELNNVNRVLQNMRGSAATVSQALKNLDQMTPTQLNRTLRTLTGQLNQLKRGTAAWDEHVKKIQAVKAQIQTLKNELEPGRSIWQKFKGFWGGMAGTLLGVGASITGMIAGAKQAVQAYADMEQEMANVRKFTGMSAEEVERLNDEFKKMDTRTSREALNMLAQEAGRLGKTSLEDVLGFVRAADKINVALDDLGEGATLTLSKLTGIFGDEKRLGTEKALLAVGSVINELSQNCSASAPYLAEFASRMGGVGAQAGLTIQQIMGFGAVLDSNNQKVEASATAVSQVITRMYQDPAKYAGPAGLEVEKFARLLREDANAALIMLLEQLNKVGNMDVLSPMFKDMGETGSRAIAALATLAGHIDEVKAQQQAANEAFAEATSVTAEFDVQNTTVKANLEKAKKGFHEMAVTLGEKLYPVMAQVLNASSLLLRAMMTIFTTLVQYRGTILTLATAFVAYHVAVNMATIRLKAHMLMATLAQKGTALLNAAVLLGRAAWYAMTGNISRATAALRLFSSTLKTTPLGVAVAAIGALVTAFALLRDRARAGADAMVKAQEAVNKVKKDATERLAEEEVKLQVLLKAAQNERLSLDERKRAIEKLNAIIPDYNAQLDATTGKYTASREALENYLDTLRRQYELEGAREALTDISKQRANKLIEKGELERGRAAEERIIQNTPTNSPGSNISTTGTAPGLGGAAATVAGAAQRLKIIDDSIKSVEDDVASLDRQRDYLLNQYGDDMQRAAANEASAGAGSLGGGAPSAGSGGGGGGSKAAPDLFADEEAWKELEEAKIRAATAIGTKSRVEYLERMDEIEVEYNRRRLQRIEDATDGLGLSEAERLKIEAEYQEALNKQRDRFAADSVDAENAAYNEKVAALKQQYIDGEVSQKAYNTTMEDLEIEHQKTLVEILREGSDERLAAESKLADLTIAQMKRRQSDTEKAAKDFANMQKQYFGHSAESDSQFAGEITLLNQVYDAEVAAAGDSKDKLLDLEEKYQQALLLIKQKYGKLTNEEAAELAEGQAGETSNILETKTGKAITGTLSTMTSAMSSIFSQMTSLIEAELEVQTAAVNKRYDAEVSRAEGNTYQIKKIEAQREKEIAKLKNDAQRKTYNMQVIQAIAQTATNALNAYGSVVSIPVVGPTLAPIAAAAAVAAGMIQVAAIKKQQAASEASGYSEGGFTPDGARDTAVGVVHAGEWVASQRLTKNPHVRPLLEALDYAQRTNTIGAIRGADVSRAALAPALATSSAAAQAVTVEVRRDSATDAALDATLTRLAARLDEPFVTVNTVTGDYGIRQALDEYDIMIRNKSPKSAKKK